MSLTCNMCGFTKNENINEECPVCKSNDWIDSDIMILKKASSDTAFLEAMIDLKQKDPIEYQLKMSQFKVNFQQQVSKQESSNQVKCPSCGCTDVQKISGTSKVASIAMFGLLSQKRKHQFKCLNPKCGYEW